MSHNTQYLIIPHSPPCLPQNFHNSFLPFLPQFSHHPIWILSLSSLLCCHLSQPFAVSATLPSILKKKSWYLIQSLSLCSDDLVRRVELTMVSLRRRRLLGLCSGSSSFVTPLPLYCENLTASENSTRHAKPKREQPVLSDDASILDSNTIVQEEPGSSNVSGSSSSKEQLIQQITGPPVKRRKRHRRKNLHNQEPCLMRGVYFKNMKWQAAIKVDKKQIHLGTVGSQEEAAHLYDRAAFMCGREPNFELPEEEKRELRKFKWDEFLAVTRHAITRKKHKRRLSPGPQNSLELPPLQKDDWDGKQGVSGFSACENAEQETSVS